MTDEHTTIPTVEPQPMLGTPQLNAALAAAQGIFPEIPKNRIAEVRTKTGGTFKFRYADLADVLSAVRVPLAKNGLAASQTIRGGEVITTIRHASGETLESTYPIHIRMEGRMHPAQEYAVSVMFARRYGLCTALEIAADESVQDDRNRMVTETFEDPDRDGVIGVKGAKVEHKATPAERAHAYADAIISQFADAKTAAGINGVWDRTSKVIDRLQDSYPDEYANVLDAYEAASRRIAGEEGEEG